jgi:hypothetical protein
MGKQSKGSIPLTPSYCGVYFKVTGFYRNRGMPKRRGRTHEKQKPQERLFIFERISTKPIFLKNAFFNSSFFLSSGGYHIRAGLVIRKNLQKMSTRLIQPMQSNFFEEF